MNRELIQKILHPTGAWAIAVATFMLFLILLGGFELGSQFAYFRTQQLSAENEDLRANLDQLDAERGELNRRLVMAERSQQVDKTAINQARADLARHQRDVAGLTEKIRFYKGLVSTDEVKPGLNLQKMSVFAGSGSGSYQFQLVLVQLNSESAMASGKLVIVVEGTQDGKNATQSLQKLVIDPQFLWTYKFRYFQNIEAEFRLPKNFQPKSVLVQLIPTGRRSVQFEERIPWAIQSGAVSPG